MCASMIGPIYHALLIGIDAYPEEYRSLNGCVNDIDAIEQILLDHAGIGNDDPPVTVKITRLAAPREEASSSSRFQAQTLLPTRRNILDALKALTMTGEKDRVLIYYAGHGHYLRWQGTPVWHEAIVPCDVQFLYDIEVNKLINDIAARVGGDLTVILDCCHSSGAFRALVEEDQAGNDRFLQRSSSSSGRDDLGQPPDWTLLRQELANGWRDNTAELLLRTNLPNYVVIAACQAVETSREQPTNGDYKGVLTTALDEIIRPLGPDERAELRWADIWGQLLDRVGQLCSSTHPQHPWLRGQPGRKVFGGKWTKQDPGLPVVHEDSDLYRIKAGSLMGLTSGAKVAVYGQEPDDFPAVGSSDDQRYRLGVLRVTNAQRASCFAVVDEGLREGLPGGSGRGRLVSWSVDERLRVELDPLDEETKEYLNNNSNLVKVIDPQQADVEVRVQGSSQQGWTIRDEVTTAVATVPAGYREALKAGLEQYARFNNAFRLAHKINALQFGDPLRIDLLNCSDHQALARIKDPHDPDLEPLPSVNTNSYLLPINTRFCVRVANEYDAPLHVRVFNCEAFGIVDPMGELEIRPGDHQVLWQSEKLQPPLPWVARPSSQNGEPGDSSTDRLVVVATTVPAVPMDYIPVNKTVQQVVNETKPVFPDGTYRSLRDAEPAPAVPAELWAARIIKLKIGPELGPD